MCSWSGRVGTMPVRLQRCVFACTPLPLPWMATLVFKDVGSLCRRAEEQTVSIGHSESKSSSASLQGLLSQTEGLLVVGLNMKLKSDTF